MRAPVDHESHDWYRAQTTEWFQRHGVLPARAMGRMEITIGERGANAVTMRFYDDDDHKVIFEARLTLDDFSRGALANRGSVPVRYWITDTPPPTPEPTQETTDADPK